LLCPVCGIGNWGAGDGLGVIHGLSAADGEDWFVYSSLLTVVGRWLQLHQLRKRRFQFDSDLTVGSEGDVRNFLLAPSNGGAGRTL